MSKSEGSGPEATPDGAPQTASSATHGSSRPTSSEAAAADNGPQASGEGSSEGARIAMFYAALFLIYGIQVPYLPVWLDWKGLDAGQVAFIAAAPFFVRVIVTPIVSLAADARSNHRGMVIAITTLALLAALMLTQASGFLAILLSAMVMMVCGSTVMPLAETVAVDAVRRRGLDYGRMRLWGSATFIVASYIGGYLVDRMGGGVTVWLLVVGAVATVLAAMGLPRAEAVSPMPRPRPAEPAGVEAGVAGSRAVVQPTASATAAALRLVRTPLFLVFLAAAGATQASHAMLYTFGALNWRAQGISTDWIGILWAIGVLVEIALFAWAKPLAARFGVMRLMTIGALACVVRWVVLAFDPPLAALIPLQVLHGLTYGATHVTAIKFIARAVPQAAAGTAQGLYATIAAGIGHGAATIASGKLYPLYGGSSYLAMAALSAVGLVAAIALWRRWDGGLLWDGEARS